MDELLKNVKTFLSSASLVYNSQDYTSAAILYFKTLFAVLDFIILKAYGKTPKDHQERLKMLQKEHIEFYVILDKLLPLYQDTYFSAIQKAKCDQVKYYVEQIIKQQSIPVSN